MKDRINEIRERLGAATPGPWHWVNPITDEPVAPTFDPMSLRTVEERWAQAIETNLPAFILNVDEMGGGWAHDEKEAAANADLIANAPTDMVFLLNALTEARAQGAAEERERLAKCADAYSSTDLYDINDGGCQFLSRPEWCETAHWLRSQKDQRHDQ